ncbi:acyl carrier protein phosphodiesterase [Zestomonas carbonaria]|uniref:Acyl carrier protein phosphodiesterase n=1 Tax=Zestomonas carbonaria TaxID=2762745 RepID=A0A7U7I7S2_9GAMM|nr:ACP phosphodiesterase [Pseudomonas carbonaria]CAD5105966.1 Acyl carrier protein phosphodiesterase [Pseudomonas carbonaria]
MNYLAHLHLGGSQPAQLLGSLYGDFVKGGLAGRFPGDIEAAIRLHRRIDAFTDQHPLVAEAKARFPRERRRMAGIVLDVFFDHCLARDWERYAEEPLPAFTARVYRALAEADELPGRLALIAPRMAAQDWLGSYRDFAVVERVLGGMGQRLSRPGLLAGTWEDLEELYEPLSEDFRRFYPLLQRFTNEALITF